LNAFTRMNGAIGETNKAYKDRNTVTMSQFLKLYNDDPVRAKVYYDAAVKARQYGDDMYAYLQNLKEAVAKNSDGWVDSSKAGVTNQEDLDAGTNFMVEKGNAESLRKRLLQFQSDMKSVIVDSLGKPVADGIGPAINFDLKDKYTEKDGTQKTWAEYNFEMVPSIAVITELTKMQSEARNDVGEVVDYLIKQVGASSMKVDAYVPIVATSTPAVYSGDKFIADISLGAISNTQQFTATVNGEPVDVQGGKAHYERQSSGVGDQTLNVDIAYKDAHGQMQHLPTSVKYNVFTGSATISATKMNMLYIGLDNPISISVPGFRPDQINASGTAGLNLKKVDAKGNYTCNPSQGTRDGIITVTAENKKVGQMAYRIRPVPKPEILLGTRTGGAISRGELATVSYVNAGLGAGFAFEGLNYKVMKYRMIYVPQHKEAMFFDVTGNTIPGNVRAALQNAHPGDMLILTDVTAQGPTGSVTIPGPSLTIN
jgi:gliding motility-associated protein GldM